jgi:MFS family permease
METRELKKMLEKSIQSMLKYRIIGIVVFSLIALFMGNYIASNWAVPHLAISGIIVGVFTLITLAGSIGQVSLLKQIDFAKPIVDIRKRMKLVNTHRLLFVKLMFLSTPVWWSFAVVASDYIFNIDLFLNMDPDFVLKYLMVNSLLIIPLVWFLNKLTYKNLHVKWVRKTIGLFTSSKTKKALEFLKDIEKFER